MVAQAPGPASGAGPGDPPSSTVEDLGLEDQGGVTLAYHRAPRLDQGPDQGTDHLQGEVGRGQPVRRVHHPKGGHAAHHVDQGGQHPGPHATVGRR